MGGVLNLLLLGGHVVWLSEIGAHRWRRQRSACPEAVPQRSWLRPVVLGTDRLAGFVVPGRRWSLVLLPVGVEARPFTLRRHVNDAWCRVGPLGEIWLSEAGSRSGVGQRITRHARRNEVHLLSLSFVRKPLAGLPRVLLSSRVLLASPVRILRGRTRLVRRSCRQATRCLIPRRLIPRRLIPPGLIASRLTA